VQPTLLARSDEVIEMRIATSAVGTKLTCADISAMSSRVRRTPSRSKLRGNPGQNLIARAVANIKEEHKLQAMRT
jgi:hypothetical protein